jgi:hypothetical protein
MCYGGYWMVLVLAYTLCLMTIDYRFLGIARKIIVYFKIYKQKLCNKQSYPFYLIQPLFVEPKRCYTHHHVYKTNSINY